MGRGRRACLVLAALALVLASGCSRRSLNETADQSYAQALNAVRFGNLAEAERLFNETLPLYAQADNPDRFNDVVAALAGLECRRGKLTEAFAHYHAALSYFDGRTNAAQITSISNALADLFARTGRKDSAMLFASAALRTAASANDDAGKAASEYELGRIEQIFHHPGPAVTHFTQAERYAAAPGTARLAFEIALHHAAACAELQSRDDAMRLLQDAARFASVLNDAAAIVQLRCASGAVYLQLGMQEDAMHEFLEGLKTDSSANAPGMDVQLLCGIGEVFFANYAYPEARRYFSKSCERALADGDVAASGYCLIRMGECEERSSLRFPSASSVLRSVSLYEQAIALYDDDPSPQHRALAMLMEASLRARLHEDADADPLFQSCFNLMRTSASGTLGYQEPFIITNETRLLPVETTPDDWWYRPFASFLMRGRHIGDALAVASEGEAASRRQELLTYPITFQDSVRRSAVAGYLAMTRTAAILETELIVRQTLPRTALDSQNGDSLRVHMLALRKKLTDAGAFIESHYPSLLPLIIPGHAVTIDAIERRAPADGCLISYLTLGDRFFAVIVPGRGTTMAADLGPRATIRERIAAYRSLLEKNSVLAAQGQRPDEAALRQSSTQLYNLLLQPIEHHLPRRIIVHLSKEISGLPLHALMSSGSNTIVSAMNDLSYTLLLTTMSVHAPVPPLNTVVVFGAPASGSLEKEYELRSVKNFYPDASVFVTESATEKNFRGAQGDLLHLSTVFGHDGITDCSTFALSGGSITMPESYRPISAFLLARPFRMWMIEDLRRDTSMTSDTFALFAMMSGASECVLQRLTSAVAATKEFNGLFYMSLLAHHDGRAAYRETLLKMNQQHGGDAGLSTAPFFYIEW